MVRKQPRSCATRHKKGQARPVNWDYCASFVAPHTATRQAGLEESVVAPISRRQTYNKFIARARGAVDLAPGTEDFAGNGDFASSIHEARGRLGARARSYQTAARIAAFEPAAVYHHDLHIYVDGRFA